MTLLYASGHRNIKACLKRCIFIKIQVLIKPLLKGMPMIENSAEH